jgi:hypothetical protein
LAISDRYWLKHLAALAVADEGKDCPARGVYSTSIHLVGTAVQNSATVSGVMVALRAA